MEKIWIYTFLSILAVSLISLVGIAFLILKNQIFEKIQTFLVSFAIGSLLGGAILHLIPESMGHGHGGTAPIFILVSIVVFFILEKYLYIHRHANIGDSNIKSFGPLNLIADAFHNFLDGILIAAAYKVDPSTGMVATFAVLAHELPQEIGDFAVLVKAGYTKKKALLFNLMSAATAFLGAFLVFVFPDHSAELSHHILPLAAGGFLYIALADLVPELNRYKSVKSSILQVISVLIGIGMMWLLVDTHGMHH